MREDDCAELRSCPVRQRVAVRIALDQRCKLAARGPDLARGLIYSGPRQVTGLVRLLKVSISA
jgi:hypothetical protein